MSRSTSSCGRWPSRSWPLLTTALVLGCASSASLEPNPKQQGHLDAHLSAIFAGVGALDDAQLEADRTRVRNVHRLGYWAQRFYERTGRYPLASRDSSVFRQTLIGTSIGNVESFGDTYVHQDSFLAELREVLGSELMLPDDPIPEPDGARAYTYGVYGRTFVAAAMLYHPVGWTEGVLANQWQYRVGAVEDPNLPILQISLLLDGAYAESRPPRWRDPSLALW